MYRMHLDFRISNRARDAARYPRRGRRRGFDFRAFTGADFRTLLSFSKTLLQRHMIDTIGLRRTGALLFGLRPLRDGVHFLCLAVG